MEYSSNGFAYWRPGGVTKTICYIRILSYPFDVHTCYLNIGTWETLTSEVVLSTPLSAVVTKFYSENAEWEMTGSSACADGVPRQISTISYGIKFRRKSAFLVINVLIPIVFLSILNTFSFLLPQESGERVSFSVTVLLSFTVFLNVIGDNIPKTSSPMPLICHYVLIVLVISGIIMLLTILCQRLYHTCGREEQVPKWLLTALWMNANHKQIFPSCDTKTALGTNEKVMTTELEQVSWRQVILKLDKIFFVVFFIFCHIFSSRFYSFHGDSSSFITIQYLTGNTREETRHSIKKLRLKELVSQIHCTKYIREHSKSFHKSL